MLGVLENHNLTNICVVVTRYFGGIKLGAGGLIRAYAGSVALLSKKLASLKQRNRLGLLFKCLMLSTKSTVTSLKNIISWNLRQTLTDQVEYHDLC